MKKRVILLGIMAIVAFAQPAQAAEYCSEKTIMSIKNAVNSNLSEKESQFKSFRIECQQYKRMAYASLADLYFLQGRYKKAKKYFKKMDQNRVGNKLHNEDEMAAKYALTLHFLKQKPTRVNEIFSALKSKYRNNFPDDIYPLYAEYKILQAKEITSTAAIAAAIKPYKSLGGIIICPKIAVTINFETNSDRIVNHSRQQINNINDALIQLAVNNPEFQYELIGHTDIRGDANYNQELSQRRALSVKEILTQINAALSGKIKAFGKGETEPELSGNSMNSHQVNRRVEIRVNCDI